MPPFHQPRVLAAVAVLLVLGSGAAAQAPPTARPRTVPARLPRAALDSILESVRRESGVPGLSAAVIDLDGNMVSSAVGVRVMGLGSRVTPRDRFHVASLAKPMTATLAAMLVEEGKLRWSSTAAEVFPEWADSMPPSLRGVTLEMLLSHTAGIRSFESGAEYDSLPRFGGSPVERRAAFARYLLTRPPASAPGTRYQYSNAGYALVGAMLERVAGEPIEKLLVDRLWRPLGITTGGFGWPARADPWQPWGHYTTEIGQLPHPPDGKYALDPALAVSSGDVNMSMEDLARFLHLHLQGLRGRPRLLTARTFARMHTPVAPAGAYGLGWGLATLAREAGPGESAGADGRVRFRVSEHDGSTGVFYTTVMVSPTRDVAIAVATNSDLRDPANRVLRAIHARFR
ncbi:MAG: beta-lactamase family protein [Gemmatimonadetes bacterium]|nr:beta-lactamase family protein [Gemmatimonadota bacterium]